MCRENSEMHFYSWPILYFTVGGEPVFILIMIVSVVSNYIFGLLIEKYCDNQKRKKTFLVLSLVIRFRTFGSV